MGRGFGLNDRGVIVTGAAGGIGSEIFKAFVDNGARLYAVDADRERLERLSRDYPDGRHVFDVADLTDEDERQRVVDAAATQLGRLDVLVHLAAVLRRRSTIDDVTEEDWDTQLDTNLKATFFLNRAVATRFRKDGTPGRIVNFASQGWWTGGYGGSVVYAASKGGVVSLTRGLARVLAPFGITVNAIAPGGVETEMMFSGSSDTDIARFVEMIPMARLAAPHEMVGAVLLLASDLGSYISGATINISGGQLMY